MFSDFFLDRYSYDNCFYNPNEKSLESDEKEESADLQIMQQLEDNEKVKEEKRIKRSIANKL